jgi:hypothetical protein
MRLHLALIGLFAAGSLRAQTASDSSSAIATVQHLFDAMKAGDTAALRGLLLPGTRFVAMPADQSANPAPRTQTDSAFIQAFAARRQQLLERMWQPVVHIHGSIATVWAPYDFHIDGQFSHCGIDTATLIKTARGWQIAALVYTTQRIGCAASPLGPPK